MPTEEAARISAVLGIKGGGNGLIRAWSMPPNDGENSNDRGD